MTVTDGEQPEGQVDAALHDQRPGRPSMEGRGVAKGLLARDPAVREATKEVIDRQQLVWSVWRRFTMGESIPSISTRMGVHRTVVHWAIDEARRRLRTIKQGRGNG